MPLLGVLLTVPPWLLDIIFNPSCTKVFGTHTFYQGRVESTPPPPPQMISKTVDSTNFNFGRPLGLSMRGKKPVELMI